MRSASAGLISLLNTGTEFYVADLLTIIQANGTITRLTSAPTDIQSTSKAISLSDATVYTFVSSGPSFKRSRIKLVIGLQVSDMQLTIMADPNRDTLGGVPWPQAARNGALDYARIVLERAYMSTWNVTTGVGTVINFSGMAGQIVPSRTTIDMQIKADLAILANPMPRNIYQPGCLHNLYDSGCTLSRAAFTVTGAVVAGGTASAFRTNLTQVDHYFELGAVKFTSGALNGQQFGVKLYANTNGLVTPTSVLPSNPANGDTFSIFPGCPKTQAACQNNNSAISAPFNNLSHYRGFPYVPVAESAS